MKIEKGKYYEFTRVYGQVVRGELIEWTNKDSELVFELTAGIQSFDRLTDSEYESFREISKSELLLC